MTEKNIIKWENNEEEEFLDLTDDIANQILMEKEGLLKMNKDLEVDLLKTLDDLRLLKAEKKKLINEFKSVSSELNNVISSKTDVEKRIRPASPKKRTKNRIPGEDPVLVANRTNEIKMLKETLKIKQDEFDRETKEWCVEERRLSKTLQEYHNQNDILEKIVTMHIKHKEEVGDESEEYGEEESIEPERKSSNIKPIQQDSLESIKSSLNEKARSVKQEMQNLTKQKSLEGRQPLGQINEQDLNAKGTVERMLQIQTPLICRNETKPTIQKEIDPDISKLDLDFGYFPPGTPYNRTQKKLEFENGDTVTKINDGGHIIRRKENGLQYTHFKNGDIAINYKSGATAYKFHQENILEITIPAQVGTYVIKQFPSGQSEIEFPNGDKKIKYENGEVKYRKANNDYETIYPDGTVEISVNSVVYNLQKT